MEVLDTRMLITLGGMAASILTSFVVVKQKVAELEKSISALADKSAALDTNLDQNNVTTQTIQKAVDTLREINAASRSDAHPRKSQRPNNAD